VIEIAGQEIGYGGFVTWMQHLLENEKDAHFGYWYWVFNEIIRSVVKCPKFASSTPLNLRDVSGV